MEVNNNKVGILLSIEQMLGSLDLMTSEVILDFLGNLNIC